MHASWLPNATFAAGILGLSAAVSGLVVKHRMLGKLTSVEKGPERSVVLVITSSGVSSEISQPSGTYDPKLIDHYEVTYPEILRSRFEIGVINFEAVSDDD